jgi:DNA-binding NarL/FixJ family response regulator
VISGVRSQFNNGNGSMTDRRASLSDLKETRVRIEGPALLVEAVSSLLDRLQRVTVSNVNPTVVVLVGDDWEARITALRSGEAMNAAAVLIANQFTVIEAAQAQGVEALVHEDEAVVELGNAVAAAARREPFYSPRLLQAVMRSVQRAPATPKNLKLDDRTIRLSPREREVALQAAAGFSNQEIGERLALSPATVRFHLHNVFQKLGIERRGELIHYVTSGSSLEAVGRS